VINGNSVHLAFPSAGLVAVNSKPDSWVILDSASQHWTVGRTKVTVRVMCPV